MKKIAYMLSLIFLMVPLAGCSGTDTEVSVDLSNEEINDLIDENLEDVMNNTTVVVFQEYNNNTTVVNQYSNNTTNNMDQSGTSTSSTTYNYNGTSTSPETFVLRLDWDYSEYTGEIVPHRDRNFTVNYSYYDYATNDVRSDTFTLPCWNYYDAMNPNTNEIVTYNYWQNTNYFYDWWDYLYNNTIRDLLQEMAYNGDVEDTCKATTGYVINSEIYRTLDDNGWNYHYDYSEAPVFFEMSLPNGTKLRVIQIRATHQYTDSSGNELVELLGWTVNEQYLSGSNPSMTESDYCPIVGWRYQFFTDSWASCGSWFGGWEDIDLRFNIVSSVFDDSVFSFTMYYELESVTHHS